MTPEIFDQVFQSVRKKWEHHFTAEVCEQIYHIVKGVPESAFQKLCGQMIWNTPNKPPQINEFLDLSRTYSKKLDPKTGFCRMCGYSGAVSTQEISTGYDYSFRCQCPNANQLPIYIKHEGREHYWPKWNEVQPSGKYKLFRCHDSSHQIFTESERKEIMDFAWKVKNQEISQDEIKERMALLERSIQIAEENRYGT